MAVELVPDSDNPGGVTLVVDGTPQSYVDRADPRHLAFEYVRRLGHVVDLLAPGPLDVLHLGGGAMTLARYVAATRPGSRQRVVEIDAALAELVRRELPLDRRARVRLRVGDARAELATLPASTVDLVVTDVFSGGVVPAHLTTREAAADVARVLRTAGMYALNLADGPPLDYGRSRAATVLAEWPQVCLLADPGILRGRRFGNLLLLASRAPLPVAALHRRLAGDPLAARVVAGAELQRWCAGAAVVTDANAEPSPLPPEGTFRVRR